MCKTIPTKVAIIHTEDHNDNKITVFILCTCGMYTSIQHLAMGAGARKVHVRVDPKVDVFFVRKKKGRVKDKTEKEREIMIEIK